MSALLSSTQVIGQQKSATQLFKGYQGETIHSTFGPQTYKFKIIKRILQNEYATHIVESATFRLRTELIIELLNQFGDKKIYHTPYCTPCWSSEWAQNWYFSRLRNILFLGVPRSS